MSGNFGYTCEDLAEMFAWDWGRTEHGEVLHHVASFDFDPKYETSAIGVASCGLRTRFAIPGLFARLGLPRCHRCSDRLGLPRGIGSPKNDDGLRGWVEARLAPPPASEKEGDTLFMGSGTDLVVAKALGRRAIGFDVREEQCEIAAALCSQQVLAL